MELKDLNYNQLYSLCSLWLDICFLDNLVKGM